MKQFLISFLLLAFVNFANAQVKTNFNNQEQISVRGKFVKKFRGKSPYIIAAKDIKALLDKDALENTSGEARPFKIAESVKLDIDAVREAEWIEEDGMAYGKFTVVAASSKSISANFDQFYLPVGAELYVYSENGEMITGPITEVENNANSFWGTWVYKGGKLTVEVRVPVENKPLLKLHISSIGYGFKDIYRTEVGSFGESAVCNINVLCTPIGTGWENERNSVALILDANSEALCSGALINNTCNLNIPFLLTANHCFDTPTQQDVTKWKFTFKAWSATCNPTQNANGTTFNGSTLRARNAGSDFCLVELNQLPPANSGITFAGWSRNTTGIQNTTIIHHPRGDVMKISRDNGAPVFDTFSGAQSWRLTLDEGATEGGSSGSPYFDQNHRIIGQHFGINDGNLPVCDRVNKFGGRFDVSWTGGGTNATRLSNWLDPNNTGAMTTDSRGIGILGSEPVCTTSNFTFVGPPVTWSSSNTSGLTINPTSGVATRVNNFSGQVTITATINGACGGTNFTRNVWVGSPGATINTLIYPSGQRGIDPVTLSAASIYQFRSDPVSGFPTSYTWILPSGFSFYSGSTTSSPRILTSSTNGSYTMYCQVNNSCGSSWTKNLGINIGSGGGGNPLRVRGDSEDSDLEENNSEEVQINSLPYPNPASETLNIELESASTVTILGTTGQKILSTSGSGKITIPITELSNGVYLLTISNGKNIKRHKILISH